MAGPVPRADRCGVRAGGCTGWRYVAEELHRAGITAHVAEPAETAARRGPKRRAKTDRSDAQLLRDLLLEGRIPESWIPPQPVLEARALVRLYKDLLDERTGWLQRVHASMFQMGVPDLDVSTMSAAGRERITAAELSAATRTAVDVAMRQVDRLTAEMTMVREQIHAIGRRQPACRALQAAHYGIGPLTSVVIWAEMGDTRRFRSCDDAVRHTGHDVTVYSSDGRRSAGHPARQGPPMLRWALYEAAVYAGRPSSPDHAYFQGQGPSGRSAGVAVHGPKARPPLPPHTAPPRRPGPRPRPPDLTDSGPARRARTTDEPAVSSRQPCCCRPARWTADQERAAAPVETPRSPSCRRTLRGRAPR